MMMDGPMLIGISLCLLIQIPGTSGQVTQLPQTQDNDAILNRMSNLETIFIEERLKTVSMKNDLAEIKSRLDTLSVQRPVYDEEFIKSYVSEILTNTLDTIQHGLVSEKHDNRRLENMALEVKDIVNKQNDKLTLLEEKTKLLENEIKALKQTSSAVPTIAQAKSTTRPARPTAQPPFNPLNLTTRPTTTKSTDGDKYFSTTPSLPIVGRVSFSGKPTNQFDNRKAKDCEHIRQFGYYQTGVYLVYIKPDSPVLVRCHTDGQMVVQWRRGETQGRQQIVQQNFNKTWNEYKYGFGSFDSDFWIGTEILFQVINSSSSDTQLRMEFTNRPYTYEPLEWFTIFNTQMTNEVEGYKLHYSHLSKNHRFYHEDQIPGNGYTFMTRDRQSRGNNCPDIDGGWWYERSPGCPVTPSNPNSPFTNVTHPRQQTNHPGYYSYQPSKFNLRTTVTATRILVHYRNRN